MSDRVRTSTRQRWTVSISALALTFGFLWTDIRTAFPWFDALIDTLTG